MSRVLVVHWHESECGERAERLRGYGHDVVVHWQKDNGGRLTRLLAKSPPDAVVIDLGRLPSGGLVRFAVLPAAPEALSCPGLFAAHAQRP